MRLWTMAVMKNVIKFLISTWLMSVSCSFSVPLFFSFFAFSEFLRFFRLRFLRLCAQCILCTLTLMSFVCYLQRLFDACFRSSFIFSVVSVSNTPYFSRLWFSHTLPTPSLISFFIFSFSFCVFIVYIFFIFFFCCCCCRCCVILRHFFCMAVRVSPQPHTIQLGYTTEKKNSTQLTSKVCEYW